MGAQEFQNLLEKYHDCQPIREWAQGKSWSEVWSTCPRGDWMLFLYQQIHPRDIKTLTLAKAHCANTVRHLMRDNRSIKAIDTAIAFGEGIATKRELDHACAEAINAAADAKANYPSVASVSDTAAVRAANAVAAATCSHDISSSAPHVAVFLVANTIKAAFYPAIATLTIDGDDVVKQNQIMIADICRKYLPFEIWSISNKEEVK